MVLEYISYGDLNVFERKFLERPYTELEVKTMFPQILSAFAYIHGRGVIHRDFKPENVMVASADPLTIKVGDFGISCQVQDRTAWGARNAGADRLKQRAGTLRFLAPEMFLIERMLEIDAEMTDYELYLPLFLLTHPF